jgi:hypothetical protein
VAIENKDDRMMTNKKAKRREIISSFTIVISIVTILFFLFMWSLQLINVISITDLIIFLATFVAGLLGIFFGFLLDRAHEREKEKQTEATFIKYTQEELTEIRKMPSNDSSQFHILHTDIWDSMVSSGILGLLEPDLVSKLATLYRQIKDASFEAEAFRKGWDEYQSTPDQESVKKKDFIGKMLRNQGLSQMNRLKQIHILIDNLFEEYGWIKKDFPK